MLLWRGGRCVRTKTKRSQTLDKEFSAHSRVGYSLPCRNPIHDRPPQSLIPLNTQGITTFSSTTLTRCILNTQRIKYVSLAIWKATITECGNLKSPIAMVSASVLDNTYDPASDGNRGPKGATNKRLNVSGGPRPT